jgi:hypothetical protein
MLLFSLLLAVCVAGSASTIPETSNYISAKDTVTNYHKKFTCQSYQKLQNDENYLASCLTTHCGRRVLDNLFDSSDITELVSIANKGMSYRGDVGGPTILDVNTGNVILLSPLLLFLC